MNRIKYMVIVGLVTLILQACSNSTQIPTNMPITQVPASIASPTILSTNSPPPTVVPSATALSLQWKQISQGNDYPRDIITVIVVSPANRDLIYIGLKNSGIYKSLDGGLTWHPIKQGLPNAQVRSLLTDPNDPKKLFAGTLGGVYRSMNGGESWEKVKDLEGLFLLMDPRDYNHLYVSDGKVIAVTFDQGSTWKNVFIDIKCTSPFTDFRMDPRNGETFYLTRQGDGTACLGGLYRSMDGGKNWERTGLRDAWAISIAQDENNDNIYFTAGNTYEPNVSLPGYGLHIISGDGKKWEFSHLSCNILATSPEIPSRAYCGGEEGGLHFLSAHGGIVRSSLNEKFITAIFADQYKGNERIIAGTEKDGIYISTDGGETWNQQSSGIGNAYIGLKMDMAGKIYAHVRFSGSRCVLYRSDDHGVNWKKIVDIQRNKDYRYESSCNPSIDAENNIYIINDLALAQSGTAGDSWTFLTLPPIKDPINIMRWVAAHPSRSGYLYLMVSTPPFIYYSDDFGKSWNASEGAEYSENYEFNNSLFFTNNGIVIYGEQMASADAGKNWARCAPAGKRNGLSDTFLAIDPDDSARLLFATEGEGMKISTDGCASWHRRAEGLDALFINTIAIDHVSPQIFYAGSDNGAFISFDSGMTWQTINNGLIDTAIVYSITVDGKGIVYAATPSGVFQLEYK